MFLALYLGVVVSDVATFWVGRVLRIGIFQPLAEKLRLTDEDATEEATESSKSARLQRIMKNAGDYVGFVIRFSVGTRGPLMLLTGFSKSVSFAKFALGASLGAVFTLPLQLWAGYTLGHRNPAAMVGIVGGISTFVIGAAVCLATASWVALMVTQMKRLSARRSHSQG